MLPVGTQARALITRDLIYNAGVITKAHHHRRRNRTVYRFVPCDFNRGTLIQTPERARWIDHEMVLMVDA